jgi:hypothetical protein
MNFLLTLFLSFLPAISCFVLKSENSIVNEWRNSPTIRLSCIIWCRQDEFRTNPGHFLYIHGKVSIMSDRDGNIPEGFTQLEYCVDTLALMDCAYLMLWMTFAVWCSISIDSWGRIWYLSMWAQSLYVHADYVF